MCFVFLVDFFCFFILTGIKSFAIVCLFCSSSPTGAATRFFFLAFFFGLSVLPTRLNTFADTPELLLLAPRAASPDDVAIITPDDVAAAVAFFADDDDKCVGLDFLVF